MDGERPDYLLDRDTAKREIDRHQKMVVNHQRDAQNGVLNTRRGARIVKLLSVALQSLEFYLDPRRLVAEKLIRRIQIGNLKYDPSLMKLSSFCEMVLRRRSADLRRKAGTEKRHKKGVRYHLNQLGARRSDDRNGTLEDQFLATLPSHIQAGLNHPVVKARLFFRGITIDCAMAIIRSEIDEIRQGETANQLGMNESQLSIAKHFLFDILREYPAWVPGDIADVLGLAP